MKYILSLILMLVSTQTLFASQFVVPPQIPVYSPVITVVEQPIYRLVTRIEPQLVPNVVLMPTPVQRVGVFGRVISETVVMQPVTIYQWRNVTVTRLEKVN
jgi:hypothetical protein